jgi:virulence-associated protein VagC
MRIRLVNTGSFQGIRVPKSVILRAGLSDELDLEVRGNALIIRPHPRPRGAWAEAAAACNQAGEDCLDDWAETIT